MNLLFIYLLKTAFSLAVFYVGYALFYKKEAYFGFNRAFLLFALMISTFLPLVSFSLIGFAGNTVHSPEDLLYYTQLPPADLNEITVDGNATATDGFSITTLFAAIYFIGVALALFRLILRLFRIARITKRHKNILKNGIRIVIIETGLPVFSFLNQVFIDGESLQKPDAGTVIAHEKVHIRQLHSLDLLFAEIVCVFQWFNPFAYLLKKSIKENHEFIADRYLISNQSDNTAYRRLLLDYSTPLTTNSLVHNFSYSLLKRRLQMMKKKKSIVRFALNLFWMLPVLFLVLFACSSPKEEQGEQGGETIGYGDLKSVDPDSFSVRIVVSGDGDTTFLISKDNEKYAIVDLLGASGKIKTELLEKAAMNKHLQNVASDSVSVKTFLEKDGSVVFFIVLGKERYLKLDILHESGTLKTLLNGRWGPDRFVRMWRSERNDTIKPGLYAYELEADYEKTIKGSFSVPVQTVSEVSTDPNEIFLVVENQPEFPGGRKALYEYLSTSINYPEKARKDSVQGRVFVNFVVEKDGSISSIKVLRGIGSGCDEEAVRVVESMPKWKPGKQKGETVRVSFNIPIRFALR